MFASANAKPAGVRAFAFVPLTIALGALVSHLLFPALSKPAQAASQPVAVVTAWGISGVQAWLVYAATMTLAALPYFAAIRATRRRAISRTAIVVAVLLSALAAFAFRYLFSSDVYAYAAYGALAATHVNPYVAHTFPATHLVDARWTAAIGFEWPSLPACIYGPAFVELSRAVVFATHFDLAQTIVALRLIEIVAFATVIALVPDRIVAVVAGLNPIVLSTVAEGHNDALVALVAVLAYLLSRRRTAAGGLLAGLSALVKATGGIVALAIGFALASRRFMLTAVGGIAVAAILQFTATQLAGGYRPWVATDFVATKDAAFAIVLRGIIALAFVVWALHCASRGARIRALAAGAMAIWALYPNDYPWYGVWLLPLAAGTLDDPEGPALLALTFSSALRYLSDVYGFAAAAPWLEAIVVAVPLCVLAWRPRRTEKLLPT